MKGLLSLFLGAIIVFSFSGTAIAISDAYRNNIFMSGILKSFDSEMTLKAGDTAPKFKLRSISGDIVESSQFIGQKMS